MQSIEYVVEMAAMKFWEEVRQNYPNIKCESLPESTMLDLKMAMTQAVREFCEA